MALLTSLRFRPDRLRFVDQFPAFAVERQHLVEWRGFAAAFQPGPHRIDIVDYLFEAQHLLGNYQQSLIWRPLHNWFRTR